MKNRRLIIILTVAAILLLAPAVAMQFTDEVKWTLLDFIVAGFLLFGTGLACEFVIRKVKEVEYRIIICATILVGVVLIWAELAVGIF